MKFYGVYKITNLLSGKFYIGSHSTFDLQDSYMGSSKYLNEDIEKLGAKIFKREWLYIFSDKEDMLSKEEELIREEFKKEDKNIYNIKIDGGWNTSNLTAVYDKTGKSFMVNCNDIRLTTGELITTQKKRMFVKDFSGKCFNVLKDDLNYKNDKYCSNSKNNVVVKDDDNKCFIVSKDDPRFLTGELNSHFKGKVVVHLNTDTINFMVDKNDPRIKTGELIYTCFGRKHSDETKNKIGEKNSIYQKGEGNSSFGRPWIYNEELQQNKKISLEELDQYLSRGWQKGRKLKFNKKR